MLHLLKYLAQRFWTQRGFRLLDHDEVLEVYIKDELDPPAIASEPMLIDRPVVIPSDISIFVNSLSARLPLMCESFLPRGGRDGLHV